jgi:uncharacterized membrane protein YphA (DoxX/SURF4 family)
MTSLGYRVYGLAALALGVVGLVWGDFALVWQPVAAGIPGRTALAYATGAILAAAGAALNVRRTAAYGAATLTALYALGVVLLHVPLVVAHPLNVSPYAGVAEQLALVAGGLIAFASLADIDTVTAARLTRIGWIAFGLCCLMFGAVHFKYEADTAAMVPKYLPLDQVFWARATGAAHIAAALAILSGVRARLAAILLTAMFATFAILVHAPLLLAHPESHVAWVMNAINLALTGAAWIVADSLREKS